jgi:hypothetical protein
LALPCEANPKAGEGYELHGSDRFQCDDVRVTSHKGLSISGERFAQNKLVVFIRFTVRCHRLIHNQDRLARNQLDDLGAAAARELSVLLEAPLSSSFNTPRP